MTRNNNFIIYQTLLGLFITMAMPATTVAELDLGKEIIMQDEHNNRQKIQEHGQYNKRIIIQRGKNNSVDIDQEGNRNKVIIIQSGKNNHSIIKQSGIQVRGAVEE